MTLDNEEALKQIPFDFKPQVYLGREDFMVTPCNKNAFNMIDVWPNWLTSGLVIYGPKGCGKSHLAHLFADKVRMFSDKPIKVSLIDALRINMRNVKRITDENQSIVVENLNSKINTEALFHLFNIYNNSENRYMLFTSEVPPSRMKLGLKDLQSRLNTLPSVEINEPDGLMLQALIVKLFNDRQIRISPEILDFIVNNAQRSYAYIEDLVREIDEISLAYQSSVNYTIVRKAMDILATSDNREPDLFDDWF